MALPGSLHVEQPLQYAQTSIDKLLSIQLKTGDDECLRQATIVIGDQIFEPRPAVRLVLGEHRVEPVGQLGLLSPDLAIVIETP